MKRNRLFFKVVIAVVILLSVAYLKAGHINLPGHGNRENRNLRESVISHVSSALSPGERAEFGGKFSCEDYKENGDVRFSANVIYYVVSANGDRVGHMAHVVCNEDKDKILEWREIRAESQPIE